MIPENVETFTTEGEKQFYRFLESVAKPDSPLHQIKGETF